MFNPEKLKINVAALDNGMYQLAVVNQEGHFLDTTQMRRLLFSWDDVSFYGTKVKLDMWNGNPVFLLDAWGLLSFFAHESFNSFIAWEWSETASLCLAAAPILYESIEADIPVPDFARLKQHTFAWSLPEEVENEFVPAFWEEHIVPDLKAVGAATNRSFIETWYNGAANRYLQHYSPIADKWSAAMIALTETRLSASELQAFFDQEAWTEWLGLTVDTKPFTVGLRLSEPPSGEGTWTLDVVLRSKKDETIMEVYTEKRLGRGWNKYRERVDTIVTRWVKVVPSLAENGQIKQALSEMEAWGFLTETSEKLLFLGADILLPSWWMALKESSLKVKAKVKSQTNRGPSYVGLQALMDFDWRFSLNGADLSEAEFAELVHEKRRLIYIRGQWVKLDPAFIKQIQELMETANKKGVQLSELLQQELLLDEGIEPTESNDDDGDMLQIQFELNNELRKMVRHLRETKDLPLIETPISLQGELRPYQQLGMSWLLFLRKHGFGACLADDMGLGKTVQMIAYLLYVKEHEQVVESAADEPRVVKTSLIVCPTSVLGNWQRELKTFAPDLKVHLHYSSGRVKGEDFAATIADYDIVLTSYGLTHQDFDELASVHWSCVILDEAQNIKNAQTKQSRAVRKLHGTHHVALTGTPMENRLSELWAIFDFTNKGYLGTLGQFQDKYVATIEREDQKDKIKELQRLIQPFLLRRTKRDQEVALNLPDKQEQKEFVALTTEQASLYEQLLQDTFANIEQLSAFERKGIILQMLNKLKQLCNHPALYLKEAIAAETVLQARSRSGKLEKLTELVDAVHEQKESCLIFTQYIGMGTMIKHLLEQRYGFEVPFLNGSMNKKKRDELITTFQDGAFPIFILSLKAGGTGLNLTAANHVIHYDRWWNPAVENQATDRAYRIGQQRFVHVHKLICTGTLEEKIDAMLDKKQALNDEIISSDNWITELSTDAIRELVALN